MVDKYIKNQAAEMARKQGISVGRLFENWVLKDLNGSLPADDDLLDDELSEEFWWPALGISVRDNAEAKTLLGSIRASADTVGEDVGSAVGWADREGEELADQETCKQLLAKR